MYAGSTDLVYMATHNTIVRYCFFFYSGGRRPPESGTARGLGLSAKLDRQNRFFTYADSVY